MYAWNCREILYKTSEIFKIAILVFCSSPGPLNSWISRIHHRHGTGEQISNLIMLIIMIVIL